LDIIAPLLKPVAKTAAESAHMLATVYATIALAKSTSFTARDAAVPQHEPALNEHGLDLSSVEPDSHSSCVLISGQHVEVGVLAVPKGTTAIHLNTSRYCTGAV
jgi:hypothetical protein